MPTGSGPISPTQHNNLNGTDRKTSADNSANSSSSSGHSNGSSKLPTVLHDHTSYVQRARVTRPAPPKPSANPMQFVQIKPCNLYQSAQEQLKRAEEVKKVKEVKKEEPEDWQCNLDNWKSSRRKRVEHIIDRVVEVKKLEEEEHDRMRRKSKTFSEMMEEKKCSRRATKLAAILYTEDESNDLSDLGIGTSSASGKSSLSEDYDNQSVMSDNVDNDKHSIDLDHTSAHHHHQDEIENGSTSRGYTSSPGYDTSSSTAPASSPDPCEYTYEGAIEDYKTRISKAQSGTYNNGFRNNNNLTVSGNYSKDSTPERGPESNDRATTNNHFHNIRRPAGTKIEDRLMSFEIKSASDQSDNAALAAAKKDLPKVDILKRRELFEKETTTITTTTVKTSGVTLIKPAGVGVGGSNDFSSSKSIKERLTNLTAPIVVDDTKKPTVVVAAATAATNRLSGDITSIKDRLQTLEKQSTPAEKTPKIDVPVVSLKDRLSSLQSAVAKEETKKPVVLIDEYQLEMMKQEDSMRQQQQQQRQLAAMKDDASHTDDENIHSSQEILSIQDESNMDTDREDSGIHTTDVSCSVSQTDEQPEMLISEETHHHHHHHINANDGLCRDHEEDSHIVEMEETIVSDMISVNSSHPSSAKPADETASSMDDRSMSITTPEPMLDLDASVNEALEIALQAIDSETSAVSNVSIEVTPKTTNDIQLSIPSRGAAEPIYENIGEPVRQNSSLPKPLMEPPLPAPRFPQTASAPIQHIQQLSSQQHPHENDSLSDPEDDQEPYYQVPKKPAEPLYEVPKYQRPIPVYENIEIFYPGSGLAAPLSPLDSVGVMEPPKEKPPPPPIENDTDEDEQSSVNVGVAIMDKSQQLVSEQQDPMKRMNSTKRIKKELRNKRSSFLGIEGSNDDETYLELTVAPPPDMAQLLQEEKRLEKQLYMKAGLYDSSDTGDSRDSGVSENHSRQSSEPFTNSSEEHEDLLVKKEKEIIQVLEMEEEKQRNAQNLTSIEELNTKPAFESELHHHEHDEVLRVERELLQLEQEELKRQRDNLILRESLARHDLGHGAKMLMSANRRSMNDINTASSGISNGHYANIPNQIYQIETDYCKSMSDLHESTPQRMPAHMTPPIPPAKPMRSNIITESRHSSGLVKIAPCPTRVQHSQSIDELAPLRNYQTNYSLQPGNMSRHTLHALSAAPKPKFTDGWVQSRNGGISAEKFNNNNNTWLSYQEKRRSVPEGFNCNTHWLVQEAEQRRIEQQRGIRNSVGSSLSNGWSSKSSTTSSPTKCAIPRSGSHDNKPLPDAVIQTLTQRVQSKGIGERRRFDVMQSNALSSATSLLSISTPQLNQLNGNNTTAISEGSSDKILSVSGKKKCSHCGEELGRGAAMIIESLRLFYHIDCFKCCVCHVQLSDGLNGTDVRVRNHKLHCQNCYSSDDGIKFSCV